MDFAKIIYYFFIWVDCCSLHQIQCQSRSRNRWSRSRHPPNLCRAWRRRPATPPPPLCGTLVQTAWSTCGAAAPTLPLIPPRPPSQPIWWTWWMMSLVMTSLPAPPPPAASLSPSSASMRWWMGPYAQALRMSPPVSWTWRLRTRWPLATSMLCSTHLGRSWMTDSCWWPMGRRCWRKGLRSERFMLLDSRKGHLSLYWFNRCLVLFFCFFRRVRAISANHRRKNLANQRSPQLNLHLSFITSHQVRCLTVSSETSPADQSLLVSSTSCKHFPNVQVDSVFLHQYSLFGLHTKCRQSCKTLPVQMFQIKGYSSSLSKVTNSDQFSQFQNNSFGGFWILFGTGHYYNNEPLFEYLLLSEMLWKSGSV